MIEVLWIRRNVHSRRLEEEVLIVLSALFASNLYVRKSRNPIPQQQRKLPNSSIFYNKKMSSEFHLYPLITTTEIGSESVPSFVDAFRSVPRPISSVQTDHLLHRSIKTVIRMPQKPRVGMFMIPQGQWASFKDGIIIGTKAIVLGIIQNGINHERTWCRAMFQVQFGRGPAPLHLEDCFSL